jgi:hypothetical protein
VLDSHGVEDGVEVDCDTNCFGLDEIGGMVLVVSEQLSKGGKLGEPDQDDIGG